MKSILFDVFHNVTLFMAGFYLLGKLSPYKQSIVLLTIDIDHFKQVNDTYGT